MSAESPALVDHDARARIADTASADTLFVVAGAGTGKTSALVDRLVRLVLVEGVPLAEIAAITFTHAAATELADRVREALERAAAEPGGGERADRARLALADADGAAITTLHSFAQRLLAEHPIEAGLPPRVEVLDEVSSEIEFAARWADFVEGLLTDPSFERPLTWATQLGLQVTKRASGEPLRDVAALFDDQWDRLLVVARQPDPDLTIDTAPLRLALDALVALPAHHHGPPDGLSGHLATIMPWVRQVLAALDGPADHLVTLLARSPRLANKDGGKNNWPDVDAARACTVAADVACDAAIESAKHAVLRWITIRIARFTIERAAERRREGRLEFHDLLVLARQLLRLRPDARAALRRRYTRLLVDEFQDTDPIQIELAVLLATTVADLAGHEAWNELPVDHERLFFVGDPTQSIYRFRRADIALFLAARDAFGKPPVQLTQNFRTVATIVGWVNEVFGELMRHEEPGKQPAYQRLHPMRTDGDGDHRVRLLGGPRTGKAGELRTEEAEAVARIIDDIRANPAAWLVSDRDGGGWREPALQDITILLPTRTSLGALQAALDARHIPHRADTGSLVYNSQEVRDLLAVLRAVADPFNGVALVAALRSPLFGCGDDDLVRYHQAGGVFDLRRSPPGGLPSGDPVVKGVEALRDLYEQRRWLGPSEMLEKVVRDRKVMVLAFGQRRYRDVWRRVRFLLDQARQFADTRAGSLRDFLAWADLQSADAARVHEPVVPEHDDDSVRIMTIHGAKGLEFPITIVSGLTTRMSGGRRGVKILWDGDDPHISLSKNAASDHFDRLADVESEMDSHERLRLLYVALTRARDHLVVSTFHAAGKCSFGEIVHQQSQRLPESLCRFIDVPEAPPTSQVAVPTGEPGVEHSDESRAAWAEAHRALLERGGRSRTVSPTALARTAEPNWHDDGVGDFESETESVASIAGVRRRGRAGTAVGKAVHAVLQTVDLATGAGIDDVARTHAQVEDVPHLAGTVARLARAALGAPIVRVAAANRHWRELYVATPTGGRLLEGYVDLLVEDPERGGLVVVDFKTDSVRTGADIDEAMLKYRRQGAAYALAVQRTTGMPVAGCCFLFLSGDRAVERWVDDLAGAVVEIEAAIAAGA